MDKSYDPRVLALDIRPRSFGFAVFEGRNRLLDWGVRSFRSGVNAVKHPASKKLLVLLDEFDPSAIVVGKPHPGKNRARAPLFATMQRVAAHRNIPIKLISRETVGKAFGGVRLNKYQMARAVEEHLPELATRLPPKRKLWQSEDYRMSIFDAAALGVAHFARCRRRAAPLPGGP